MEAVVLINKLAVGQVQWMFVLHRNILKHSCFLVYSFCYFFLEFH